MENRLFEADQLLKLISDEMDMVEFDREKLQRTEQQFFSLMSEKDKLLLDLEETWQKGEMNAMIQDTSDDIRTYERGMREMLEDQQEKLNRNVISLKEKEATLIFKRHTK